VRLKVDHFALTANNITYAAFGDAMKYWNFFPAESGWGRVPVWGFGTVIESQADGIAPGERFYGYYPMSTDVVMQATRIGSAGFTDGAAHRAELHMLYNNYLRTSSDPSYQADTEPQQMLLRPLFLTSFVIEDFFDDNDLFGANQVVLSSASSKTSYGTAFAFAHRKAMEGTGPRVVGLTSARNRAFVESLQCYDFVLSYEEVALMPREPSVYIDMAGGLELRRTVHEHLADQLFYSCVIGNTQWDAGLGSGLQDRSAPLPGAKPTFFFAPTQIKKRFGDWTPAGFAQRFATSWQALMQPVMHGNPSWVDVQHHRGPKAMLELYAQVVKGDLNPREGHIVVPA
jgi:hypothetical protein